MLSDRAARVVAAICALIGAALLVGPVLLHPTEVLGLYASEGPHHLARLAAHMQDDANPLLFHGQRTVPVAPRALNLAPSTMLVMWPVFLLWPTVSGLALSWNVAWAALFGAGVAGAWWLGRELEESPWAAAVLVSVVASAAFVQDLPNVGRPETMVLMAWPLHLALLARALKDGGRWTVGAALSFAFLALQGGYPALFLGLLEPLAGLVLLQRTGWRRAARVLPVVALAGVVALAPWVLLALEHPPAAVEMGRETLGGTPVRGLLPWGFSGQVANWGVEPRTYVGVVLGGAALAGLRWPMGRWATLALGVCVLLALGPEMRWTIDGQGVVGLAALVHAAIDLVQPTIWARIGVMVPILAGLAALPLVRGRPAWALALIGASFVEHTAVSRAWQSVRWELEPQVDYDVPWIAPLGGRSASVGNALKTPRGPHLATRVATLGWLDQQMPIDSNEPLLVREENTTPAPTAACAARDLYAVRLEGFTEVLVLHGEIVGADHTDRIAEILGPGEAFPGGVKWPLPTQDTPCSAPLLLGTKAGTNRRPDTPEVETELPDRILDRNRR